MVPYLRRYANRIVLILGLIATCWFVWENSIGPRIVHAPLDLLIGLALRQVLLACVCAGVIWWCIYLTVSWTGRGRIQHPLRSAGIAAWFVPAMILTFTSSPIPVATGGVLVLATTRLMVARWDRNRPALSASVRALFWKRLAVALACSLAIHMGVLAVARGSGLLAATLFAASLATMTSLAMIVGAYAPKKPARLSHSVLGLLLILLMIVGVTVSKRGGNGHGAGEDTTGSGPIADDSFPGVILLRELEKNAVLIAPSLKRESRLNGFGLPGAQKTTKLTRPLDVSFSGEYWMFLPRYRRPPPQSLVRRGTPSRLSFATNGGPMMMEAHQPLNEPLDPASCDKIQVEVNGPDMRRSLALELLLVDTEMLGPGNSESLGRRVVRSVPAEDNRDTLVFSCPAVPRLKRFNEIKMVFLRPGPMNKSVKIEVERMTLVPR